MRHKRRLRVAVINGHVGIPIRHGAIEWILSEHPRVEIILAQEVRDGAALRKALGPDWATWPHEQPSEAREDEALTYVCYRPARFEFVDGWNEDISFGGQYPRRLTGATLRDRRTGQVIAASSAHTVPLGRGLVHGSMAVRQVQSRQILSYAQWANDRIAEGAIPIIGGDWNQPLAAQLPRHVERFSAHTILRRGADMVSASSVIPSGELRLMELFAPANDHRIKVRNRTTFEVPVKGMDHEVVLVKFKVRKRRR